MALNTLKWCATLTTGCALAWAWMFYAPANKTAVAASRVSESVEATALLGAEVTRTTDRLRVLQIRDSLLRTPASPTNGLVVLIDPAYGQATSQAMEKLLREQWVRAGAPSKVPVIVAAVVDSASTVSGFPRKKVSTFLLPITAFLPSNETGSRCMSIVRISVPIDAKAPKYLARNLVSPETIDALFGPCVYYATYGKPGTELGKWLSDGGWRLAHHSDPSAPTPHWDERELPGGAIDRFASIDTRAWRVRAALRLPGVGCLGGQSGRCVEATMPSSGSAGDSAWRSNVVSLNGTNQFSFYLPSSVTNLGPYDGWLVSGMVRSLGAERFQAFWQSNAPVSEAFRSASGQDLDGWIRDWGNRVYGSIAIGPGVPLAATVAGVLTFGLAIMVAISVARRRRVA